MELAALCHQTAAQRLRLSGEHVLGRLGYLKAALKAADTSKHLHSHQGESAAAMQVQPPGQPALFLTTVFLSRHSCYSFLCVDWRLLEKGSFSNGGTSSAANHSLINRSRFHLLQTGIETNEVSESEER